ncbi:MULTISPECIES: hypothetical protein [Citrobacter freundii complex]|uniref:hypothetical protein n=1 Tax=Citrobacter freundii complex TaxID=1344959 RepID=UPI0006517A71|nr:MULTISPECIES: hypothetical protein [Citrobacter freundii complex]KLV69669.1 hypothetical protein SK38_03316 [Citrobacter sp. MGH110]NTY84021.1 hypothetical protein [Citrobacter werkmanii]
MAATSPQLITDQLFEKLSPSIEKGENLIGEFELFSIIRDAKKIPVEDESLAIQGLAWIVFGDMPKGCDLCEAAISINPSEGALWGNYAVAVGQKGNHALQRDILKRSVVIRNPSLLVFDFIVSSFWADYSEMSRVRNLFKSLDSVELTEKQEGDYMNAETIYNTLDRFPDDERNSLSRMANIAMEIMISHNLKAKNSGQYVAPDGMLSFNYDVFNTSADFIVKLNDELATKIVEHGLYNAKSIVLFTPGD